MLTANEPDSTKQMSKPKLIFLGVSLISLLIIMTYGTYVAIHYFTRADTTVSAQVTNQVDVPTPTPTSIYQNIGPITCLQGTSGCETTEAASPSATMTPTTAVATDTPTPFVVTATNTPQPSLLSSGVSVVQLGIGSAVLMGIGFIGLLLL